MIQQKKLGLLVIYFLWSYFLTAQVSYQSDIGGVLGVNFTFGTTLNRIGLFAKGYAHAEHLQLNMSGRWQYNFKSWGPPLKGKETQLSIGVIGSFGEQQAILQHQFIELSNHQTGRKYSIGYAYTSYKDDNKIDQVTGTITLQSGRWQCIVENDAFSFTPHDRFRTAAAKLTYLQDEHTQLAFNLTLWIGNPFFGNFKAFIDKNYPSRFGYKDMTGGKYTNYSHGIVTLQVNRLFQYGQIASLNLGVDWEYFRHFFQNWLIHDTYFLPKKWTKLGNPHIPMLDTTGSPYLFKPNQKVKKATFFGNLRLNPTLFY